MVSKIDPGTAAVIDRLDSPGTTLDALHERLAAAGVEISRSSLYRYRRARTERPAPPLDVAARVAALAPPPAPEPEPALEFDGEPAEQVKALGRVGQRLLGVAERARAIGDVSAETRALSEAGDIADRIRHLRRAMASATEGGRVYSDDEIHAAGAEVRRRLDEIAAGRGETLVWDLDGAIPESDGGPKLRRPAP